MRPPIPSSADRLYWATIAIACGAPSPATVGAGPTTLAKQYGTLRKARHDLDAFYDYYRPMRIGDPNMVAPGGVGKGAGFFDFTLHLDNPTVSELEESVGRLRQWVARNQADPEFASFQINFSFSGHGEIPDGEAPSIVLADRVVSARDLAPMLLACLPEDAIAGRVRLDLYLDCCHSAAIAQALLVELARLQRDWDEETRSCLTRGQVYCACLDDEESFELHEMPHSVFTYAFLNECSRRRPDGVRSLNLGLRDVGWFTEGRQHPLLLDFSRSGRLELVFPMLALAIPVRPEAHSEFLAALDKQLLGRDPIGAVLPSARAQRAACGAVEQEIAADPGRRVEFSRDEILTSRHMPFL